MFAFVGGVGMADKIHPVLIVGAGPTGLALAIALRLRGVDATIIDRAEQGANTSRAAVIHARTLEVLDTLGVTATLIAQGIAVPTFRIRDRDHVLLDIGFSGLRTRYPFTLMCPQNLTEAILRDRFLQLGGEVRWSTALRDLDRREGHLVAMLSGSSGDEHLAASWIVGCDGFHSRVRELAGIDFAGGMYEEGFVLADVVMDWPLPRDEVDLFLSPAGLVVVAPLPGGRFRIVATVDDAPERPTALFVQRILDERGPRRQAASIREVVWSSRFHVHHRLTATPLIGNIILCGDAAHVHSPAGGQGMNTGIQDAVSLAEPLCDAMLGDHRALEAWASRRHEVARSVVALTNRMTRAATLRSVPARYARNTLLRTIGRIPSARLAAARRLAGLDY